ncbi:DUF6368 family protein [Kitasatospora sp. NPDC050543]|uniref:DUF6368 family protein n=1 Tax=Kitasatospora sp. NPDC050543 TaxID=3364054 RepID=UPI0037AD2CFC
MSGPVLVIELAQTVPPAKVGELRELLLGICTHFEEPSPGTFDLQVSAQRLGAADTRSQDPYAPFPLPLLTSGAGDAGRAEAGPQAGPEDRAALASLIGFNPFREDWRRPLMVSLRGLGFSDLASAESYEAGYETRYEDDDPELAALIGFTPVNTVDVIAFCSRPLDHTTTALLTAAVMDVVGGVAVIELPEDQVPLVAGLPGVLASSTHDRPTVIGTSRFLRAWAGQPGFRLLK